MWTHQDQPFTIVLDLDETLVHSRLRKDTLRTTFDNLVDIYKSEQRTTDLYHRRYFLITNSNGRKENDLIVILRPGVRDFLHTLTQKGYRLAVWSAGDQNYVNLIVQLLFDNQYLSEHGKQIGKPLFCMHQKHICWFRDDQLGITNYTKPFSKIREFFTSYSLPNERLILFDNRSQNAMYTPNNLVRVPDFSLVDPLSGIVVSNTDTIYKRMDCDNYLLKQAESDIEFVKNKLLNPTTRSMSTMSLQTAINLIELANQKNKIVRQGQKHQNKRTINVVESIVSTDDEDEFLDEDMEKDINICS